MNSVALSTTTCFLQIFCCVHRAVQSVNGPFQCLDWYTLSLSRAFGNTAKKDASTAKKELEGVKTLLGLRLARVSGYAHLQHKINNLKHEVDSLKRSTDEMKRKRDLACHNLSLTKSRQKQVKKLP